MSLLKSSSVTILFSIVLAFGAWQAAWAQTTEER